MKRTLFTVAVPPKTTPPRPCKMGALLFTFWHCIPFGARRIRVADGYMQKRHRGIEIATSVNQRGGPRRSLLNPA